MLIDFRAKKSKIMSEFEKCDSSKQEFSTVSIGSRVSLSKVLPKRMFSISVSILGWKVGGQDFGGEAPNLRQINGFRWFSAAVRRPEENFGLFSLFTPVSLWFSSDLSRIFDIWGRSDLRSCPPVWGGQDRVWGGRIWGQISQDFGSNINYPVQIAQKS